MKKTLVTAVALATCAGTLCAQLTKEDVITFSLTAQAQSSVSTSKSVNNSGNWSQLPTIYKTTSKRLSQTDVLRAIAYVLHGKNANYYSSKAQLVLVQGELSGFMNVGEEMSLATHLAVTTVVTNFPGTTNQVVFTNTIVVPDRFETTSFDEATIPSTALVVRLGSGRNYEPVPDGYDTSGAWPVGHHQPWGQIFVKDTGKSPILCENVTFFFAITIEECYDCFFLNSFISDATFKFTANNQGGPPCCSVPENMTGNGKDKYYMTLTFDNSLNNPYLDPQSDAYVGYLFGPYPNIEGVSQGNANGGLDGITPDFLAWSDPIRSGLLNSSPFFMRFTLNGIVTYTWNLKLLNNTDITPDFIGSASYDCNGYGFISLFCGLLNGSAKITEKTAKVANCCLDLPWYDFWYGVGWDQVGNSVDRATPVNIEPSLSYHAYFDEEYEPGEQFDHNPPSPTGNIQ